STRCVDIGNGQNHMTPLRVSRWVIRCVDFGGGQGGYGTRAGPPASGRKILRCIECVPAATGGGAFARDEGRLPARASETGWGLAQSKPVLPAGGVNRRHGWREGSWPVGE